jgi:hypothetical protein
MNLGLMIAGYLACALWTATDEDGEPLDDVYSVTDFSAAAHVKAHKDCADFIDLCQREGLDIDRIKPEQFGHDFWLTRNRHGAGFWDRGLGEVGDRLTTWAHAAGSCDVYESDTDELEL